MTQVLVRRDAISVSEVRENPPPAIGPGEILLAVEQFAVTANNVTYAAIGEAMKYWDFFPAPDGFGIVPVWGHARVVASNADGFDVGERVYGYLPMASHLVVAPGAVKPGSFVDTAPHRQHLAAVYNQYRRLAGDPGHHPDREDIRAVFDDALVITRVSAPCQFSRANIVRISQLVMNNGSNTARISSRSG